MASSLHEPGPPQWHRRAVLSAGLSAVMAAATRPLMLATTAARSMTDARKIEPAWRYPQPRSAESAARRCP